MEFPPGRQVPCPKHDIIQCSWFRSIPIPLHLPVVNWVAESAGVCITQVETVCQVGIIAHCCMLQAHRRRIGLGAAHVALLAAGASASSGFEGTHGQCGAKNGLAASAID